MFIYCLSYGTWWLDRFSAEHYIICLDITPYWSSSHFPVRIILQWNSSHMCQNRYMSYEVTNELDHLPFLRWNKNKRKLYNFFLKDLNLTRKFFDIQRILLLKVHRFAWYLQLFFFQSFVRLWYFFSSRGGYSFS